MDLGQNTEQGLMSLQLSLRQLIVEVKDVKRQDLLEPSEGEASEAYLRYRAQRLQSDLSDTLESLALLQPQLPADESPLPWSAYILEEGGEQDHLDRAVDSLIECSQVVGTAGASSEDVLSALDVAIVHTALAYMRPEATAILAQALSFSRQLCVAFPSDGAESWLARFLVRQAAVQAQEGSLAEGLRASQEAVAIARRLFAAAPDQYRRLLVETLWSLGFACDRGCHYDAGVGVANEALLHGRQLFADPQHEPELAVLLDDASNAYSKVLQHEEAVKLAREAVTIRERLWAASPDARLSSHQLANSLMQLAFSLCQINRPSEALDLAIRSVALSRKADAGTFKNRLAYLADRLMSLASIQCAVDHFDAAFASAEEASILWRDLATHSLPSRRNRLEGSLGITCRAASGLGDFARAAAAIEEALSTAQAAVQDSSSPTPSDAIGIARCLHMQSELHTKRGDTTATIHCLKDAQALLSRLDLPSIPVERGMACQGLTLLGCVMWDSSELQSRLGQHAEALAAAQECVMAFRQSLAILITTNSLPNVKDGLERLLACHEALEQSEEARKVQAEIDQVLLQLGTKSASATG
jgi:tetratricopeptide (TPR) repeat protein